LTADFLAFLLNGVAHIDSGRFLTAKEK
jgi:hypothetical protein